jgi:predicted lipid-binding transport protein (Tim44 family)
VLVLIAFRVLSRYQMAVVSPAGMFGIGAVAAGPGVADARLPAERGLEDIRGADPSFSEAALAETVDHAFRAVQAAWTARDMARAADVVTPEIWANLQKRCERLRASGRVNRVESITLQRAAVIGARQAGGYDHVTVQIVARLVDYTTDESGRRVLEGNPFEPIRFEERWSFVRPSGPNRWRVSAIA